MNLQFFEKRSGSDLYLNTHRTKGFAKKINGECGNLFFPSLGTAGEMSFVKPFSVGMGNIAKYSMGLVALK